MNRLLATFLILSVSPLAVHAEGSPWVPEDGSISVSADITVGSTSEYFFNDQSIDLNTDLEGTFVWFNANYGYDDIWAFDFRTGYARSRLASSVTEEESVTDTSFGVTYQIVNEFEADNGLPTVSVRAGLTLGGDYDTDRIEAIGDGADGLDLSLLAGKSVTDSIALAGDLTFRSRGDNVADSFKFLLSAFYNTPLQGLSLQLSAGSIRTDSDVNLGDPGFGVAQFPETDRDSDWLIVGANKGFENGIGLGFSYSSVLSGKNIPDTDIGTVSVSYGF